jgi:hypothetical protein
MKSKMKRTILFTAVSLAVLLTGGIGATFQAHADGAKRGPSRSKVIDFEGDLVEGMNKKPLDSLNQISEADRRRNRPHLYQKRKGFRSETEQSLRELRYYQ